MLLGFQPGAAAGLCSPAPKNTKTGTISCSVLPVDYNLELTYLCSNNLISINPNGTFIVGNNA
ncbi:MAG: hypothetical protein IJF41_00795, partial [Clostridia bacterium]|nr:hypothetical protein [Clostridia bacterium]